MARPDRHHLGLLKWTWSGTRQVLLVSEASLLIYFKACAVGRPVQMHNTWPALRELSAEQVKGLVTGAGQGRVYTGTVAEGDTVYIPPGWVACEKAQGTFAMGLQKRVVPRRTAGPELLAIADEVGTRASPGTVLHSVVSELGAGRGSTP